MTTNLNGLRVFIIGGSKYLGEAIAREAAARGATVIIGARDLDRAEEVARQLPDGRAVRVDVTDESSIEEAATMVGAVDHIVITAAAHHNVTITEIDHDRLVTAFEAKVFGPMLVAKHFSPRLSSSGSITLFSGVVAWAPSPPYTVMGVSNGAVSFLASHLAKELAPVRVNAISPGMTDSGTWDGMGAEGKVKLLEDAASGTLAGRAGTSQDIVDAAVWLMGAGFVSGETIHVEGGAGHA